MRTSNDYKDINPWAGLSPYEDPDKAKREGQNKKIFCGRNYESYSVSQLISDNIFVTLYGKSGTGKTSLLNAGVFPRLRQKRYHPISIRLSMDAMDISFQQCIIKKLAHALEVVYGQQQTVDVVPLSADEKQPDYLWSYFARTNFTDSEGRTLFPVIVFDQFEEVFRNRRDDAEILLRQIAYLMDESHALTARIVNGLPYKYDFNFRFVASIREDDLYQLEDSIDNNYLPELKRCRYRLRSLTKQGAEDAILIPGKGLFKTEEQTDIVRAIIEKSKNEDGSISTNIISLLCSRIFVDKQKTKADCISLSLVKNFIKGNPFEHFIKEATQDLSNKELNYLEDNLIDSSGRRNSISENDFKKKIRKHKELLEGDTRILQCTSISSDGKRIELIHDSFCAPLERQRQKRIQLKRVRQLFNIIALTMITIGGAVWVIHSMYERQQKMLISQSRFLAEKASKLVDEGDSYTARILALEALPKDIDFPDRPYTVEAEGALRKANQHGSAILRGHTSWVKTAIFSSDGKYIVSASWDGTIRIWDAKTGRQLGKPLRGHTRGVNYATFSPDGKLIVSASNDNTVRIWDAKTGRQVREPLLGHTDIVNTASFSPDGKRVVSASWDGTIRIWDAKTGRQVEKLLLGHGVTTAFFSPNGKRIISVYNDGTIHIWDAKTYKQISPSSYGTFVSPDGKYTLTVSLDNTLYIHNYGNYTQIGEPLQGHTSYINSASFSPDGKLIVSASNDKTIRIWDAKTGRLVREPLLGHSNWVYFASFSPDGERVVSASQDFTIRIWDIKNNLYAKRLEGHTGFVKTASFSPDGKLIVSASNDSTVRIWDVKTGRQLGKPLRTRGVDYASFSPDGKLIVSASNNGTFRIWDAKTGRLVRELLLRHSNRVKFASISPDGKLIVSLSFSSSSLLSDTTVRIWNTQTGSQIGEIEKHESFVRSFLTFSPDSKYILLSFFDKTIRIFDVHTRRQIGRSLRGHTDDIKSASFSPDGKCVVSSSKDRTICIWDVQSGKKIRESLNQGDTYAISVSFSPNGKNVISLFSDGTIRIWDAQTLWQIGEPLLGHTGGVNFSPDSKRIVSASEDSTVCIWEYPPLQELIQENNKCFESRQLTPEERRKYYLD